MMFTSIDTEVDRHWCHDFVVFFYQDFVLAFDDRLCQAKHKCAITVIFVFPDVPLCKLWSNSEVQNL